MNSLQSMQHDIAIRMRSARDVKPPSDFGEFFILFYLMFFFNDKKNIYRSYEITARKTCTEEIYLNCIRFSIVFEF